MTKITFNGLAPSDFLEQVGKVKLELYALKYRQLRDVELSLEPGPELDLFTATILRSISFSSRRFRKKTTLEFRFLSPFGGVTPLQKFCFEHS